MKTCRNIIFLTLIFYFSIPSPITNAKEDYLEDLSILVYLHEDGSATIAERRIAYLTEGTENYDVIENLGKSKIANFFVQENDIEYQYIDPWDSDASLEEKAYKNGIIPTENGYELVWGIGEYGWHEYIIVYTVTDFIKQLDDHQILFWRFVNDKMNIPPKNVSIKIEMDRPLTKETEKIWAFGFDGDIHFENNKVVATSKKPFEADDYATVLIQFPQHTFQTKDILDKSFAEVQEEAFEGSDYGKRKELQFVKNVLPYMVIGLVLFLPIFLSYFFLFREMILENKKYKNIRKKYDGTYYREPPYQGHFLDLFFLLHNERLVSYKTLIHALLLKWLHEEKISIHIDGYTKRRHKPKQVIHFHETTIDHEYEGQLFDLFLQLSEEDSSIALYDKPVWSSELKDKFADWMKDLTETTRDTLIEEDYLKKVRLEKFLGPEDQYHLTDKGEQLEKKIYGFMNYMIDFSLIHEHKPINVNLYDDLMIWAGLFDLTKEVRKQFEKVDPDMAVFKYYDDETVDSLYKLSDYTMYSNYSAFHSSSDGAGGSASFGGGGGSFGGGSGGGTR